jgi:hypothetical protein
MNKSSGDRKPLKKRGGTEKPGENKYGPNPKEVTT